MRSLIDDPQYSNLCASTSRQDWNEQTMSDCLKRETGVTAFVAHNYVAAAVNDSALGTSVKGA